MVKTEPKQPPCPYQGVGVLGFAWPTAIPCGYTLGHEGQHAYFLTWTAQDHELLRKAVGQQVGVGGVRWPDGTVRGQTETGHAVGPQGSGDRIDGAARAVAPDKPITDGYDSAERWAKLEGELAEWKREALDLRFSLEQANKDWEAQQRLIRNLKAKEFANEEALPTGNRRST